MPFFKREGVKNGRMGKRVAFNGEKAALPEFRGIRHHGVHEFNMISARCIGKPYVPAGCIAPDLAGGFNTDEMPCLVHPGSGDQHAVDFILKIALAVK